MKTYTLKLPVWNRIGDVMYIDTPFGRFQVRGTGPCYWELLGGYREDGTWESYEKSQFRISHMDTMEEVEARYVALMEEYLEEVK